MDTMIRRSDVLVYDTLGLALMAALGDGEWAPTIDLHVQFLAPAQSGRLIGRG
jgi:acyl-coenzyme A thioesterase PaaI-like protein